MLVRLEMFYFVTVLLRLAAYSNSNKDDAFVSTTNNMKTLEML